jgi:probable rRNA maturation factor
LRYVSRYREESEVKIESSFAKEKIMTYEIEVVIDEALGDKAVDVEINDQDLRKAIAETLHHVQLESGSVTVVITDNESVRMLNLQYRQIDAPTDILSFSSQTEESLDDLPAELLAEVGDYLGDLLIAYPYTVEQAQRYGNPLDAELRLLVVHGALHLLGYDHDTPENQSIMWQIQGEVLQRLGDSSTHWEREYEV